MYTLSVQARLALHAPRPQLYRVLHWWEQGKVFTDSKPEVNRMEPLLYTDMTPAIQWMQFDMLYWEVRHGDRSNITPEEISKMETVYQGTDPGVFISNGHGLEEYANYISGERLNMALPAQASLAMGGTVVTGTEHRDENYMWHLDVATLTDAVDISLCNPDLTPWYTQHATIATTHKLPDGTLQVNPFPQFGGRNAGGRGVIVPLLCSRPVSIPMRKLEKLALDAAIPSPYNPPL